MEVRTLKIKKKFMCFIRKMNEIEKQEKYLKLIKEIIKKHLKGNYKIILFGSRATGSFRKNSDYDIGILGNKKVSFSTFLRIKDDLDELPILVDLVDFQRVSEDFKKIALKVYKIL